MKQNGALLTDNEKLMIVNVYNYFSNDNLRTDDHHKFTLRKRVAEVLGICERTVAIVILDWRSYDSNKKAEQLSTPILRQFLFENGYEFSKWKLLWVLYRLGYYFSQRDHRNILHKSPNNVAYRCHYLHFCFANLEASGHSSLVVIFGAIVVFRNGSSNKLYGCGRKRNDAEEWNDISDIVKDANITPNQVNYHGNFNAEIFEDLFSTLCKILYENYGPVSIHMDGASYHKRRVETISSSNAKKQNLIDWLNAHEISFSSDLKRPELLELVRINKEKVPFSCIKIAEQYEHEVSFTPPYHCELQPIEGVWAVVKGEVARSGSHPNLLSIRNTLLDAFKKKVTSQVIIGLWRRVLKNAKKYLESDEDAQLIDDKLDEYSSFDEDHVI
uniref:Tc1-like transposase DDE domain-containing protein n=1 Tax=Rhizophagus irregularis (strain DAOM 181602 / DAOM 197198 / MUCL 43194) TaxID=747089 RepID=U9UV59_RHIID